MKPAQIDELISAYVDGELRGEEKQYLLGLAQEDPEIESKIRQEQQIKEFLKTRVKPVQTPHHLKLRINQIISDEVKNLGIQATQGRFGDDTIQADKPFQGRNRFLFSIAALFMVGAFYMFFSNNSTMPGSSINDVEFISYQHFLDIEHTNPGVDLSSLSSTEAQRYLLQEYEVNITVPELQGAYFAGVAYLEFHDDYKAPVLTYATNGDDYIHIFAFEIEGLETYGAVVIHPDAATKIVEHDDVYIVEYGGKDVVSWRWNGVWYCAVSNHSGDTIAAMLPH